MRFFLSLRIIDNTTDTVYGEKIVVLYKIKSKLLTSHYFEIKYIVFVLSIPFSCTSAFSAGLVVCSELGVFSLFAPEEKVDNTYFYHSTICSESQHICYF